MAAQLALRESVGRLTLDELLERKEGVSEEVLKKLREKAETFFAEVEDGGIKDVILPGEIREIMNTVLAAEKRRRPASSPAGKEIALHSVASEHRPAHGGKPHAVSTEGAGIH